MPKIIKNKIVLEGEKEYVEALQRIRKEVKAFREEVKQLNLELEKKVELLKKLG